MAVTPCLEIGGTHVTAAVVDVEHDSARVVEQRRFPLNADAEATSLLDEITAAAATVNSSAADRWGVAIPGPFDYERGIGEFHRVGKFDSLRGVDVATGLAERLGDGGTRPSFAFLNDATAYTLGEWRAGAARGSARTVGLTLGTGLGGCFLADGTPVTSGPDVPPGGVLHLLSHGGRDIEDHVSRRALIEAYARASGLRRDVHEIAEAARTADVAAAQVFADYYRILGQELDPWIRRFGAEVCVIGGSIARSWDLLQASLRLSCAIRAADLPEDAPLIGAAVHANTTGPHRN